MEREAIAVFDIAYAGFGRDFDADLYGVRRAVEMGVLSLIAFSFSKIASLYEERLGVMVVVLPKGLVEQEKVQQHLGMIARPTYSNPPATFAKAMGRVLVDKDLRATWNNERNEMAQSIRNGGLLLAKELDELRVEHGAVDKTNGMFALLPFSPEEVKKLEQEQQVYMLASGRINKAAVNAENAKELATRMAAVLA